MGSRLRWFAVAVLTFLPGVPARAVTVERVSVSTAGGQADLESEFPSISSDGRYVAFWSRASALVANDMNGAWDVFVHDRAMEETTRVSVASDGTEGDGVSWESAISANGRYVAFSSAATTLVANDSNRVDDVFVHDRDTGVTERVSVASDGTQANHMSEWPGISADGRYVAFASYASNLVAGDTNDAPDVFVHDRVTGVTERVSVANDGSQANAYSVSCAISADGRYVAFSSVASNLVPGDTNGPGADDIFVRDRVAGTTIRVSVATDGTQGDGYSLYPDISADGRYVVFESMATTLVSNDSNDEMDVFVHDCVTGDTVRASVASDGTQAVGNDSYNSWPCISPDGRYVAFDVLAGNLVADDSNGADDVFLHDCLTGETVLVSTDPNGIQGNGESTLPALSNWAGCVAYTSYADNLVANDTNEVCDVFVACRGAAPTRASLSSFETGRYPWAAFAAGPGEGDTWRRSLTGSPAAHSGVHAMSAEVTDQAITGLRLDLPTEPTAPSEVSLRAWAYVDSRTTGDCSAFFGFVFSDDYPTSGIGWSQALGWEVLGDITSQYQLVGATQAESVGLATGGWHLVEVIYSRDTDKLTLRLDATDVAEVDCPNAAHQPAVAAVLGGLGTGGGAAQKVYFDDARVSLTGYSGPPEQNHSYVLLEGPEQIYQGNTRDYVLHYGNGYPMLGVEEITGALPDTLYAGLSLPDGYSLVSATPAPSRNVNDTPVWEFDLPELGQGGEILLEVSTPSGLPSVTMDRMWAWGTTEAGAGTNDPPNPPTWMDPTDATWSEPEDMLPQQIEVDPGYDLYVVKQGPRTASPGDAIYYAITVSNSGYTTATHVPVRDLVPALLGGGDRILGVIGSLEPGDTWTGTLSGTLPWGIPDGALMINQAYVPSGPPELAPDDNTASLTTRIQAARDPNAISVSPEGGVNRGQMLTYTLECENVGLGIAYGVYATCALDPKLDDDTLLVSDPDAVTYDPDSRTLLWEVGTLSSGAGAETVFTVEVAADARRARPIIEQGIVCFPSVPEETPTNLAVSIVKGSFSDIAWNHWAVLQIEQAYEGGVVGGYGDGTYRGALTLTRDQMAVFIARALAGGDAYVPTGPPTPHFSDVDEGYWAYKYIEYAVDNAVVGGYPDGSYRPTLSVDRGQMAVFIARALAGGDASVPTGPPTATFPDVTATNSWSWCYKHVEYAVSRDVVSGYGDGNYHPEVVCTRDQMAVFVARAFALPM